jgi:Domain of unknown function (DUF4188)
MAFTPILAPVSDRPNNALGPLQHLQFLLLNNLSLSSWLLLGGLIQLTAALYLPVTYLLVPTLLVLLGRFVYSLLVAFHVLPNPHLHDAMLHRTSTQVPNDEGTFSDTAASEKVVCFHLGSKYNHPLGIFAPNVKDLGDWFKKMVAELNQNIPSNDFLGGTSFIRTDAAGSIETVWISYWRSIEAIHAFAYGPTHREAWDWWNKLSANGSKHIGINHEIFAAQPGQWEAIFVNHQPTLSGATTYLKKGDKLIGGKVEDQWISGLIDANKGKLRSSAGRLGWQPEKLYEKYDRVPDKVASGYEN